MLVNLVRCIGICIYRYMKLIATCRNHISIHPHDMFCRRVAINRLDYPRTAIEDYTYAWDADEDYEFDQIDGIDVQELPVGTQLEVSVSHGHWSGDVWDIGLLENYWSSLRLLVQFASGTDEDLHRLVPLMREAPSSKPYGWKGRRPTEICSEFKRG